MTTTFRDPSSYERAILVGLQQLPHIYEGLVAPAVIAERRSKNRAARRARRINRR